jgi:tRNA U34 5-methylaminomethyl-2-thiouridine-forming methyltransferase MnmC
MISPVLVKTADGSDTLFAIDPGEHYHSTFGAVQESMHIFIGAGLKKCDQIAINLFEVGFGTGLNAYLTALETLGSNQTIRYISIERYPLPPAVWSALNYPSIVSNGDSHLFRMIHEAEWNEEVNITNTFSILKLTSDLRGFDFSDLPMFDLVYFDPFSPEKQPELWATLIFSQIASHCAPMAKFVTYSAKGEVRRSLIEAGFDPERIPGPPGKRHIITATLNPFSR